MEERNALDFTVEDFEEIIEKWEQPSYRARQIFKWLYRGVNNFDQMTDIPQQLREALSKSFYIGIPDIVTKQVSKIDCTTKYLLKLTDESLIECVLLRYRHGNTLCISCQVGCRMGCYFCASTRNGLVRNLTPGEMVGQIITVQKDTGERISNIVIMGSGEPLDNYNNVMKFLKIVNSKDGLNIGLRRITLSTCGLVEEIDKLAEERIPITLSVSLHAASDSVREKLMPVAKKYKIKEIIECCKRYVSKTGRRVTFEYALVRGVNDSEEDARKLAGLLKGLLCHVNLIPVNPIEDSGFRQPGRERIALFRDILKSEGIPVTVRREMGRDISGACGQLKAGYKKLTGSEWG